MAEKLTNRFLDVLPADSGVIHDAHQHGLRYVPTGAGRGKWAYRYQSPTTHTRRDAGLGLYPGVPPARARQLAMDMAAQIRAGVDPIDARRAAREATRAAKRVRDSLADVLTFEKAARTLHDELKPGWKNAKHAAQWLSTLEAYVFPTIGAKSPAGVTAADCADALRPIWLEKPETAARTRQRMHAVMQWAKAHGHVSQHADNPVSLVDFILPKQGVRTKHQPAMPWRDVPAFVRAHLAGVEPVDSTGAALLFLILTAARSGEVRGARWDEFDLAAGVWTVPAERMKAGIAHRVALSAPAVELVAMLAKHKRHCALVFSSPRGLVLSDMTLTALLRRVNAKSDTRGRVATAHGFRSSFRDWASEQGYSRDLAEKALAHTVRDRVEAAYHRTDLLEQRRAMMDAWSRHVLGLPHDGDNVPALPGAATVADQLMKPPPSKREAP